MSEKKLKAWVIIPALLVAVGFGLAAGLLISGWSSAPEIAGTDDAVAVKQFYSCGMHPDIIRDEPGNCPICGMKLTPIKSTVSSTVTPGERKIKYWQAPMDPTFISDKPGKSPMGMDSVPVYEDQITEGAISIDPVTVQNMGLRTVMVKKWRMTRTVRTVGYIDYDETGLHIINTKITGWIEKLHVNTTGEVVQKGQPLLEIYSPELVSTQEEYLSALRSYAELKDSPYEDARKGALGLLYSTRKRLEYWDIDQDQIDNLERTGEIKKTLILYSPATGVVLHKNVIQGALVKMGSDLFRIADLSKVWVLAEIYESELPFVSLGQKATVDLPYLPGESLQGEVTFVYPYLDPKTRSVKVRLEFPNPGYKLKPEMYVDVMIASQLPGERVIVPQGAVLHSGRRELVFMVLGEGKYAPREVTTGVTGEELMVEVIKGLLPGEMIVASGQFMLDSESKTQEAIQKMIRATLEVPAEAHQHPVSETMKEEQHEQSQQEAQNLNLTPQKRAHFADEVFTCPMDEHSYILQVGPGICPECGMQLVPITQTGREVYTCPMEEHHHILFNHPGDCPECGMKLIKLESKGEGGGR